MNYNFDNQYSNNYLKNKIGEEYYSFLKNIYNKNSFEQQQDFNNFLNELNKIEDNKKLNDILIELKTKKELEELKNEKCKIMKTYHNEEFKNIKNDKNIVFYIMIFIIGLFIYFFVKSIHKKKIEILSL